MNKQELTYWVALALMPRMWTKRKNEIYVKCYNHNPQISIIDLFEKTSIWDILEITDNEKELFSTAKNQLANHSFLVEEMLSQGYDILPITCEEYPKALKSNLKYNAQVVIYTTGNTAILNEHSIAIVGSRNADGVSLTFTDNVAKHAVADKKTVVSGFAKGVDRQALDSTVGIGGSSVIVLPQGIMTFSSGFKQYFKHLSQGKLLVMSVFAPKAPWSVEFAMSRNSIIYALASEIFVAQSDDKGGTWAGATEGLKKNRPVFVRVPQPSEKNANMLLIQKGAKPVDMDGRLFDLTPKDMKTPEQKKEEDTNASILNVMKSIDKISAKELIARLNLDWTDDKMKKHLDKMAEVEKIKVKNRIFFKLKGSQQLNLFSSTEEINQTEQSDGVSFACEDPAFNLFSKRDV